MWEKTAVALGRDVADREEGVDLVKSSGFDVTASAAWLEGFTRIWSVELYPGASLSQNNLQSFPLVPICYILAAEALIHSDEGRS